LSKVITAVLLFPAPQ